MKKNNIYLLSFTSKFSSIVAALARTLKRIHVPFTPEAVFNPSTSERERDTLDRTKRHDPNMASSVLSVFETYQKARVAFVQSVADLATRAQNIEIMQNAGVMQLLRPLLLDNVPSIQQSSALALGRLANYSDDSCSRWQ